MKSILKISLALAAAAFISGAANAETPSWCGPNKATLALLDGFGGNSWRIVTAAAGRQEAEKCPNISEYIYVDGQGDTQKAISDINSMAARGIDAIVVFGDAGPAVLPALTNAYRAGTIVVPYRVVVGGEEGRNYTKYVAASFVENGILWGEWIKEQFPDGANLLFLSGPAGNSQGLEELEGMKQVLDDKYVFLNPDPFAVTNWDPALTQQVLSAAIAQHDDIDVIVSDFGPSLVGALPVFENFDRSIPALATSDGNSLGCLWHEKRENHPDFDLYTLETGTDNVRLAVQWAVAEATGGTPPESDVFTSGAFENSITGKPSEVQCRADLPGQIYLSSGVPADVQAKEVGN
ncbi:MAG: substrate-binding domain-containing protein [Rhizobiaceae bacterium]